MRMTVREEALPTYVAEVFFQTPQSPRAILTKAENVVPNLARPVTNPCWLRKYVRINQPHKVTEAVIIAVMRGCRQ